MGSNADSTRLLLRLTEIIYKLHVWAELKTSAKHALLSDKKRLIASYKSKNRKCVKFLMHIIMIHKIQNMHILFCLFSYQIKVLAN